MHGGILRRNVIRGLEVVCAHGLLPARVGFHHVEPCLVPVHEDLLAVGGELVHPRRLNPVDELQALRLLLLHLRHLVRHGERWLVSVEHLRLLRRRKPPRWAACLVALDVRRSCGNDGHGTWHNHGTSLYPSPYTLSMCLFPTFLRRLRILSFSAAESAMVWSPHTSRINVALLTLEPPAIASW